LTDEKALVKLLGERFIERKDVHALQSDNGAWRPVKCEGCWEQERRTGDTVYCPHMQYTMTDFRRHLAGEITLGHYLVNPETQTTKLFAFDLDLMKPKVMPDGEVVFQPVYGGDPDAAFPPPDAVPFNPREAWLQPDHPAQEEMVTAMRALAEGLARRIDEVLNIPVAIVDSGGKGLHVYGFTGSILASQAQALANMILEEGPWERSKGNAFWRHRNADTFGTYQYVEIEVFPKQTELPPGGYGNLMKLPLGINRKTGRPAKFISVRGGLNQLPEMDPMKALQGDQPWE
jgi:hypothetical protein